MPAESLYITKAQIRTSSIILYDQYEGPTKQRDKNALRIANMTAQREKRYSGMMSAGAKKRLSKAIEIMTQTIQPTWMFNPISQRPHLHRLSFITLTISDNRKNLTASEAYKLLLRPFLQWLTKYKKVNTYIWKAELQARGQIHYHITTPTFIRYDEIRQKWNDLQDKNGLLDDFKKKHHHSNPNSTDVHETYKIKNLSAYLLKYLTKEVQKATKDISDKEQQQSGKSPENSQKTGKTVGKIWDCSMNLKKAKYFTIDCSNTTYQIIDTAAKYEVVEIVTKERCSIVKIRKGKASDILNESQRQAYQLHLNAIRNNFRDQENEPLTASQEEATSDEPAFITNNINSSITDQHEIDFFKYAPIPTIDLSQ